MEAYGVRGGLKVQPYSTQPSTLLAAKTWWLRKGKETRRASVVEAKRHGASIAAFLAGLADRDQAHAWRGWTVLVPRSDFPAPAEGEYYWVDLVGCQVSGIAADGQQRVVLGAVLEVIDNGAHAILRIARVLPDDPSQPMLDAKGKVQETLVPFVDAYVSSVDITAKSIESDWPADF